jgi:hypothetical protein
MGYKRLWVIWGMGFERSDCTNKNGNSLMAGKVPGNRADTLREASDQISAKSPVSYPAVVLGFTKTTRYIQDIYLTCKI